MVPNEYEVPLIMEGHYLSTFELGLLVTMVAHKAAARMQRNWQSNIRQYKLTLPGHEFHCVKIYWWEIYTSDKQVGRETKLT